MERKVGRLRLVIGVIPLQPGRVNPLSDALQQLRAQIASALAAESPLPSGIRLEAESVTLSLGLEWDPDSAGWRLCSHSGATPVHSLTFQFRVGRVTPGTPFHATPPAGESESTTARQERIAARCRDVFGAPGFDNSARAEVFGEWLADVNPAEIATVLGWIQAGTPAPDGDPLLGRFVQIRRLLGFAPLGESTAAGIVRELLAEPVSPEELVQVLGEHWRFGTHWALPESAGEE